MQSDSSLSEEEDFFHQNITEPYRFEPCYTEAELVVRRRERETAQHLPQEHTIASTPDRTTDRFWCTCQKCMCLPTDVECICCHEISQSQAIVNRFDPGADSGHIAEGSEDVYQQKCVTEHPDFEAHLNEGVLDTYFRSHRYNWQRFPKPRGPNGTLTNEQYRLVGYRFTLDWLLQGERLGKKRRIPLPACIVNAIRSKYPADDNVYMGFKYADLPTV